MHKIPLTQAEEEGLRAHGLDIGTPSQLSDVFRQGLAWGRKAEREACAALCERLPYGSGLAGKTYAEAIRGVGFGGALRNANDV